MGTIVFALAIGFPLTFKSLAPPHSKPAPAPLVPQKPRPTSDTIHSAAMAPTRSIPAPGEPPLYLHAREGMRNLELRSGPGQEFPLIGSAKVDVEYPVLEWRGRWFMVSLDENGGKTAWVHYDKVELVSENAP
ncbi:hypothetical protein WDW37_21320 [Bdellovibrionota bacterium FG-1]